MTSSGTRALRALQIVNASPDPLGVTAIAAALGTLPGTAYRSLDALERGDYVTRYRASTLYQIGATATRLRQTLHAQFPIRNLATPFLRRLALAANETVSLTVPIGWQALRLIVIAGANAVRSDVATGLRGPLEESLAGRTILAGFDAKHYARYLVETEDQLSVPRRPRILSRTLREIETRGFALETVEGAGRAAVSFPLRFEGRFVAAIGIDGPVVRGEVGPQDDDLDIWQGIVAEIEQTLAQTPAFRPTPFAHLDAGSVNQALTASASEDDGDDD